ncbi:hypothetical protein ACBR40_29720 [Nonomuraea sp. AD125B]|uniref:hypothetical protein n=1 Tax=Nonomuraea sp. AD125B TaxID=3242897 RepID=UPI0035294FE3
MSLIAFGDAEQVTADPEQRRHQSHRALRVEQEGSALRVFQPVADVAAQPEAAFQAVPFDIGKARVGECSGTSSGSWR